MAAFLVWGNKPNSFAVANGSLLDYQNMPEDYEGKFRMYEWNAMQISSICTGPNGYHWMLKVDQGYSARGPTDMLQYLSTQLITVGSDGLAHPGRGRATYVAFAPNGTSWFIRYDSRQCYWGPQATSFPSTWQAVIADLERTHPRKDECIDFVAFGLHDLLLIRFENGNSAMSLPDDPALRNQISKGLIQEVEQKLAAGWTLGNRTALCSFNTERWFLEWRRGSVAEFRYSAGIGESADLARIQAVLSGEGSNAAAVANTQTAQLIAANSRFATQLALSRIL